MISAHAALACRARARNRSSSSLADAKPTVAAHQSLMPLRCRMAGAFEWGVCYVASPRLIWHHRSFCTQLGLSVYLSRLVVVPALLIPHVYARPFSPRGDAAEIRAAASPTRSRNFLAGVRLSLQGFSSYTGAGCVALTRLSSVAVVAHSSCRRSMSSECGVRYRHWWTLHCNHLNTNVASFATRSVRCCETQQSYCIPIKHSDLCTRMETWRCNHMSVSSSLTPLFHL
jgi:hypothetical protein